MAYPLIVLEMIPYFTERQLLIWRLRSTGVSKAEIGRRLGITRQSVYDAEKVVLGKVDEALRKFADSSRVDVEYLDVTRGVLLGTQAAAKQKVIITLSSKNGVQTWHYQQPECGACQYSQRCRRLLLDEAEERGIEISAEDKKLPPSKLAHTIFSSMIPELTNYAA